MRVVDSLGLRSAINVTPLVDVVLVLLIIFMVIAPQLVSGPALQLPRTEEPKSTGSGGPEIRVSMQHDGSIWIDGAQAPEFAQRIGEIAQESPDSKVIIEADARLTFGEVRRAMLAVEAAGLADVGLLAERHADTAAER